MAYPARCRPSRQIADNRVRTSDDACRPRYIYPHACLGEHAPDARLRCGTLRDSSAVPVDRSRRSGHLGSAGSVESSDSRCPASSQTFMPELAGTQAGDDFVLRITFDTDAPLIGQMTHPSGGDGTLSFDASSLVTRARGPRSGHARLHDRRRRSRRQRPHSLMASRDDLVTPATLIRRRPAVPAQLP